MSTSKRLFRLALASMVVAGLGSSAASDTAQAADSRKTQVDQPAETRTESSARADRREMRRHPGGLVEAKWLIGAKLHDADGKDVGRIKEFWVDLKLEWKNQKLFVSADPKALRDAYQTKMDREDRGPAASPATSNKKR